MKSAIAIVAGIVLAFAAFLPIARADDWNQKTKLTFSQPVEIPGRVLPAGSYWFVLANSDSNRNIVRIFNSDWSREYAILYTANTVRAEPADHTELKFAERPHNKPEALLKWYYPGSLEGHQFQYSPRHEREFARDAKVDVMVHSVAG